MNTEAAIELKTHTDLINVIAERISAKSYLEIGTFSRDHNFNHIRVEKKVCVDPDPNAKATVLATSDEYFNLFKDRYDIVFIDGLHEAGQVKRDIINSWKVLNEGGAILIHDCNPHSEAITHYPRDSREWCGTVYKTAANIKNSLKFTVDFDYGVMVLGNSGSIGNKEISWDYFDQNRKELLNLVSIDEAIKIIDSWK